MLLLIAKVFTTACAMPRSIALIKSARTAKVRCDTANIFRIFFSPWLTNYANALQRDRDTLAPHEGISTPIPEFIFHYSFLPRAQFRESYAYNLVAKNRPEERKQNMRCNVHRVDYRLTTSMEKFNCKHCLFNFKGIHHFWMQKSMN